MFGDIEGEPRENLAVSSALHKNRKRIKRFVDEEHFLDEQFSGHSAPSYFAIFYLFNVSGRKTSSP